MLVKNFFTFEKGELSKVFIVILLLSLMFSFFIERISLNLNFIFLFFVFFFWFSFLIFLKIFLVKYVGYAQAVKMTFNYGYLNKYGFFKYQSIGRYLNDEMNISKFKKKGLPMPLVSIFLFIITLGFFILPNMWRYKWDKIPHKFIGSKKKWESSLSFIYPQDVTEERITRALTSSFLAFPITALLIKVFVVNLELYYFLIFSIFWIALLNLFPFFGTLGYQMYIKRPYYWFVMVTIMSLFFVTLLLFNSVFTVLLTSIFSVLLILSVKFYKDLLKG